jgi:hypothetical protein
MAPRAHAGQKDFGSRARPLQPEDDDSSTQTLSPVVAVAPAPPRISSVPEYSQSLGPEAIELGAAAGLVADAHQALVIEESCGVKEDGRWAAFEVGLCEPRQNGKGGILEIVELGHLFLWDSKLIVHSSHEFRTSLEHFYRLQELVEEADQQKLVKKVIRGHGEEGFELKDGTRMHFRTRTKKGGRGFSGDFLALDEAMIIAEYMLGALLPTLRARPNPQVWYTGSAVDQQVHEHGVAFSRVRERGLKGDDPDLAYFEWSVDEENPSAVTRDMAENEELWAQSNPALDVRISREHMRKELNSLDLRTFSVELLGIGDWPKTDAQSLSPILPADWDQLEDLSSIIQDPVVLAYDVSPERRCSIAAAGRNQRDEWHVELLATWPGTQALVEQLLTYVENNSPTAVVCDGYGPAASMVGACAEAGVVVQTLNSSEHAQACGQLADAVIQQTVRHRGESQLQNAVRGAAVRPLGDAWAWSRKSSAVDISPLVAATLALSVAMTMNDDGEGPVIF